MALFTKDSIRKADAFLSHTLVDWIVVTCQVFNRDTFTCLDDIFQHYMFNLHSQLEGHLAFIIVLL